MWSPSVGWFSQHLRHMKRRAVCVYPHAPVRELDVEVVGETNSGAVWTRVGSAILGAVNGDLGWHRNALKIRGKLAPIPSRC